MNMKSIVLAVAALSALVGPSDAIALTDMADNDPVCVTPQEERDESTQQSQFAPRCTGWINCYYKNHTENVPCTTGGEFCSAGCPVPRNLWGDFVYSAGSCNVR